MFSGMLIQDLDQMLRISQLRKFRVYHLHGFRTAANRFMMGCNNNGVAAFQREHSVAHRRNDRIGTGGNGGRNPHRLGDPRNSRLHIRVQNPPGFLPSEIVPDDF